MMLRYSADSDLQQSTTVHSLHTFIVVGLIIAIRKNLVPSHLIVCEVL